MRYLGLVLSLAGCLQVPSGKGKECSVDSECNTAAGEACFEGLCYGDPPLGIYAATLSSPVTRTDLITTEIPVLELPADGNLGPLTLAAPVTFSGRVEAACTANQTACSTMSIAAQVRITRPSRFPGGPALRLSTLSKAGVARGTDSFTIRLPRTHPGEPPYVVTIDPEGGGDLPPNHGGKDPAQLVPPRQFSITIDGNIAHQTHTLGTNASLLTGTLKDGLGSPLTKYRVVALGRFATSSTLTEVSSVHYSTDGTYALLIADGVVGPIEIVAKPYDPQVVAPTLHILNVEVSSQVRNIWQPTGLGSRVDVAIPIQGRTGDGQVRTVPGAHVTITGATETSFMAGSRAVMIAETTTGDDGIARLSLLDGDALAGSYRIRVVPPASSTSGIVFDEPFVPSAPAAVRLPQRVAIKGTVVDISGTPLADVSVTARRSLRFLWSLDTRAQSFLDEIPATTAITPETGEFVVWIDPTVASTWGHYDLLFETPSKSPAPNWVVSDLEIPRVPGQMTISVDKVTIPDAAYLRGLVVDGGGAPVAGSALRVFRISDNDSVCREVYNAPDPCADDAKVMGHSDSDDAGVVRLNLPRP
jgi:hypothetical protein